MTTLNHAFEQAGQRLCDGLPLTVISTSIPQGARNE
jgi:hypothetical protein